MQPSSLLLSRSSAFVCVLAMAGSVTAQPLARASDVVVRDIAATTADAGADVDQDVLDLGSADGSGAAARTPNRAAGTAVRAAAAAAASAESSTGPGAAARSPVKPRATVQNVAQNSVQNATPRPGVERAVFDRVPIRVGLPVGRERLVSLPGPVALHVPDDIDRVARIESIDRTLYVTALVPFKAIRVIAEAIEGGQQIPLDLVADASTAAASPQLEVFHKTPSAQGTGDGAGSNAETQDAAPLPEALDMVQLTRFAARMLYAPRRLAVAMPQVQQVPVAGVDLPSLMRGVRVQAVPVGQWRSGALYVTAVRVTNRAAMPVELPLDNVRGSWLAATAQHGRLGPAGSDTDTTAVYLVCDRSFEACL